MLLLLLLWFNLFFSHVAVPCLLCISCGEGRVVHMGKGSGQGGGGRGVAVASFYQRCAV